MVRSAVLRWGLLVAGAGLGGCGLIPGVIPAGDDEVLIPGSWLSLLETRGLEEWQPVDEAAAAAWQIEGDVLVNRPRTGAPPTNGDLVTRRRDMRNFDVHFEFRMDPGAEAGVFLRGTYEIRLADSFGRAPSTDTCGALAGRRAPSMSAELRAGEWQVFDADLKRSQLTVMLNGHIILDQVDVTGAGTVRGLPGRTTDEGPLVLRGCVRPGCAAAVSFRNMRWRRLE